LAVEIGRKLRELRKAKKLSQGDIQNRTGLLRNYTSRVENGMTVPNLDTLEKYAHALEIPLYELFYDGEEPPEKPILTPRVVYFGGSKAERVEMKEFATALSKINDRDLSLLLEMAQKLGDRNRLRKK
jgi:transcriptional regulator with XRE-family HTH domain